MGRGERAPGRGVSLGRTGAARDGSGLYPGGRALPKKQQQRGLQQGERRRGVVVVVVVVVVVCAACITGLAKGRGGGGDMRRDFMSISVFVFGNAPRWKAEDDRSRWYRHGLKGQEALAMGCAGLARVTLLLLFPVLA